MVASFVGRYADHLLAALALVIWFSSFGCYFRRDIAAWVRARRDPFRH